MYGWVFVKFVISVFVKLTSVLKNNSCWEYNFVVTFLIGTVECMFILINFNIGCLILHSKYRKWFGIQRLIIY